MSFERPWGLPCGDVNSLPELILSLGVWSTFLAHLTNTDRPTVLYAIGIVELELESTSALVLLLFVIPLAFTLSGFLLWIMYSLNGSFIGHSLIMCSLVWIMVPHGRSVCSLGMFRRR